MNSDTNIVITSENVSEMFASAIADPTLLSNIEIENLLSSLENDNTDYL